jgi:hypothetical protein
MRTSFCEVQAMSECKLEPFWTLPTLLTRTFLQRALKERGIDKMLDEARADNRENDLENMKPGSG